MSNVGRSEGNQPRQYTIDDLKYLMKRLRDPDSGCPWDIVQSYKSITPSTIEEAYEVVDAIEHGQMSHLKEELGDLLFQVIFYSQLGEEDSYFNFDEIVDNLVSKLVRRHPHVFPDGTLEGSQADSGLSDSDVKAKWEEIKKQERAEKGESGLLADIPVALPATTRGQKLQKRASSVGFDWDNASQVILKVEEEIAELKQAITQEDNAHIEEELGDLFFCVVNLSRHLKIDAESALRRANMKFERRFNFIEENMSRQGEDLTRDKRDLMEKLWEGAKSSGL